METTTRILIADPGEDFRKMLSDVINAEGDLLVVGTAGDGQEALTMAEALRPDVLLTDLVLARLDGMGLLKALRDREALVRSRDTKAYHRSLRILRGNPTARAGEFSEALESLRKLDK